MGCNDRAYRPGSGLSFKLTLNRINPGLGGPQRAYQPDAGAALVQRRAGQLPQADAEQPLQAQAPAHAAQRRS